MIRRICPKPGRIRPIAAVLLIGCMTLVDAALANAAPAGVAERCAQAAVALRDSLDAEQTRLAVSIFDEDLRRKWYYVTGSRTRKNGLTLGDMTDAQRVLAHRLLRCALSDAGYQKVAAIIRLDDLTAEFIGDTIFKVEGPLEIGREWYWFALFGEPDDPAPWGWQVEGHHLGLNITVFDGEVSVTPAFMGVNPAEIQVGPLAGWRMLDGEQERAYALMDSLDAQQREQAVLGAELPRGIFTTPGKGDVLTLGEGLTAAEMTGPQRQLLWLLLDTYLRNADPEIADRMVTDIIDDGWEQTYFAWFGSTERGNVIYYRIHGPSILIEFINASNLRSKKLEPDPNHIHSIMRVPGGDFGADLLRLHYLQSPDHAALPGQEY